MSKNSTVDLQKERALQQALFSLPKGEAPSKDLWPEIQNQLSERKYKNIAPKWLPWIFAATLLLSFSALYFSWSNLQQTQKMAHVIAQTNETLGIQAQVEIMEREYALAKSALLAQIGMNSFNVESGLFADISSNLIIIEQATNELKAAIIMQPDNPSFSKLLKATYQQELVFLTQLAKLNRRI